MQRLFPFFVWLLLAVVSSTPAWATSQEEVALSFTTQSTPAAPSQLLKTDDTASTSKGSPPSDATAPKLSTAYSSLYKTDQDRTRYEGKVFVMALLASLAGWGVGAASSLVLGAGAVALLPPLVAFAIAYAIDSYYQTPFGRNLLGAFGGLAAGGLVSGAMVFLSTAPNAQISMPVAIGVSGVALLLLPVFGAWTAAITGQDQIERRRLVALGPTPSGIHGSNIGIGINGRF